MLPLKIMCLNPQQIRKKGNYKKDNYRGLEGEYYEINTFTKCGSCEICMNEKANNWVIRNYYESKTPQPKAFITLTYKENPYILIKKDLQDFFKRLRRRLEYQGFKGKIRYFGAGEYGEKNKRPHKHAIIYGWNDNNAEYLDINKKGQIVYQSELIQETWGLGRTSYQDFDEHEAPYIALYETAQESFKRNYKVTRERLKVLEEIYRRQDLTKGRRIMLGFELLKLQKELEENKAKYMAIKEYNTWSIGLGFENFFKEYAQEKIHDFKVYIEDKEFYVPTPWLKKLANDYGDIDAAKEIFRREDELRQSFTIDEEIRKNLAKINERRKDNILKWQDTKDKIEIL